MKILTSSIVTLMITVLLFSCDTNKKLNQEDAEKAIKEFVSTNSFGSGWNQKGSFEVNSITSIEPISQFSETEASSIVNFNFYDVYANGNLILKFNFKRDIDKHWFLTNVEAVSGTGSQGMSNRIENWKNINILVQKGIKNKENNKNKSSIMANIRYLLQKKVKDIDGNVYAKVKIGEQVWMVENLLTTRLNDGSSIPETDKSASTQGYCWYNNDIVNKKAYGALYNWYAVNTGKLCPKGWHVPTDAEWKILETYLGMSQSDADSEGSLTGSIGKALKSTYGWKENGNGANSSGFTALPGGYRYRDGGFSSLGVTANFWSASEYDASNAWYRYLGYVDDGVYRYANDRGDGFSVRCLQN